jgi:hypothetical protein
MNVALPLDQMTIAEKLQAFESLWDDLCRNAESVVSPSWHGDILLERETRMQQGGEQASDWEEAKRQIRESIA